MSELPIDDAKSLIQAIADLARMADRALPPTATKLTQRLRDHLGELDVVPNTSVALDPIERANVQLALDEVRETSSVWEEFGLAPDIGNWGGVSFPSLIAGNWQGPGETARQFVSVAISASETVKCQRASSFAPLKTIPSRSCSTKPSVIARNSFWRLLPPRKKRPTLFLSACVR
jgi:hypothetical protein